MELLMSPTSHAEVGLGFEKGIKFTQFAGLS